MHTSIEVTDHMVDTVSQHTIYFGHKSVGADIISGLEELVSDNRITILESRDVHSFAKYSFLHSGIGANTLPLSKIDAFKDVMHSGFGNRADFAFFKFCFVDFHEETDINEVFTHYTKTLHELNNTYPETTFIHVTTPLIAKNTNLQTKLKNTIKPFIGRTVFTYKNNIYIHRYNKLIRAEYEGVEPIFDLARLESTIPDGDILTVAIDNEEVPFLYDKYASDEGHLSSYGGRYIARHLLSTIYDLIQSESQ